MLTVSSGAGAKEGSDRCWSGRLGFWDEAAKWPLLFYYAVEYFRNVPTVQYEFAMCTYGWRLPFLYLAGMCLLSELDVMVCVVGSGGL